MCTSSTTLFIFPKHIKIQRLHLQGSTPNYALKVEKKNKKGHVKDSHQPALPAATLWNNSKDDCEPVYS